jgi:hypothetical protein
MRLSDKPATIRLRGASRFQPPNLFDPFDKLTASFTEYLK